MSFDLIPEFRVIERDDGTWEAWFLDTPADAPPDVVKKTFHELEMQCMVRRIGRALRSGFARTEAGRK